MKLKIIMPILFPILTAIGAYIAGFDFNQRGGNALMVYFLVLWSSVFGFAMAGAIQAEMDFHK